MKVDWRHAFAALLVLFLAAIAYYARGIEAAVKENTACLTDTREELIRTSEALESHLRNLAREEP